MTTTLAETQRPPSAGKKKRHPLRQAAKIVVWLLGIPAVLALLLYLVMLITPIRLPFGSEAAEAIARSAMPPTSELQLGEMALTLENGIWPVVQFSPVLLTDSKSGARVEMEALEVGFSPARALFGQPGAVVTLVKPHIQIIQDLFGPRVTNLEVVADPEGGEPTVRVLEGLDSFPGVAIGGAGIELDSPAAQLRSDNDWLIYNLEASEQSIADIVQQAAEGRFSKLVLRDGVVEMADSVYGLFRRFEDIDVEIGPSPNRRSTHGSFRATLGGRTMAGTLSRTMGEDGGARLEADVTNIDFAAFMPFIDDPTSLAALRGAGALSIDVRFAPGTNRLVDGGFKVDLTGLDLRLKDSYFPIVSSILDVSWVPEEGRFTLADTAIQVGQSSAKVSGSFAMGIDKAYGPTLGLALEAHDVYIQPNDMAAPAEPFDSIAFSGWSAPLYGALGIDRILARKGEAEVEATGRVDSVLAGLGFDIAIDGHGVSADDLKRLWPYLMGKEARDWFVDNVPDGVVTGANMRFNFPVGTLALDEENVPLPPGAITIDMVGTGVSVRPTETMAPIAINGETRLTMRDGQVTVSAGGGVLQTAKGPVRVSNPALVMDNSVPTESIMEVSGDIAGAIPALLALAKEQQPDLVANAALPVDPESLSGEVDLGLVTTIRLPNAAAGTTLDVDYVVNGQVKDFASSKPIEDKRLGNGQLFFSASQDGYQIGGTAEIDGLPAEVEIAGTPDSEPSLRLASTLAVEDLKEMGLDASEFLTGQVRFVAQPRADGAMQMGIDLEQAGLDIRDLGISKAAGVPGTLQATIRQEGGTTHLTGVQLLFGTVHLEGALDFDAKTGLQSADFTQFALSEGDNAQVSLTPISGGYAVRMRGAQLDLKPMLNRFFGLGEGAGGVQSTQFDQSLALDIELDRALGYYATTAFNLDIDMSLRGSDLRRANLTAQFGDKNAVSVVTNPGPGGRTMSVAFSDAGTILRLLGIYSQLAGGEGSLVLTTYSDQKLDAGQLQMRNFAIVDEANVAQVLGNHSDSRAVIERRNRLDFNSGVVNFIRRSDRVEVTNAVLSGDTVGGTLRGFIYTNQRQYDLTGTYIPLFGLNNAFQQIPLLGPLLGGRDGEGLLGVTFAVQGPLDSPVFRINPLSALVPGVFRELFEFRAKEQPRVE